MSTSEPFFWKSLRETRTLTKGIPKRQRTAPSKYEDIRSLGLQIGNRMSAKNPLVSQIQIVNILFSRYSASPSINSFAYFSKRSAQNRPLVLTFSNINNAKNTTWRSPKRASCLANRSVTNLGLSIWKRLSDCSMYTFFPALKQADFMLDCYLPKKA